MRFLLAVLLTTAGMCSEPPDGQPAPDPSLVAAIRMAPPQPEGLWGRPYAPADLDDCAEMRYYARQFGLPERFDRLGYRESHCTNTPISRTGCCVGFWQLHKIVFRDHRTSYGMFICGANWWNIRGADGLSKQRQACATRVLFDVAGYQPWAL